MIAVKIVCTKGNMQCEYNGLRVFMFIHAISNFMKERETDIVSCRRGRLRLKFGEIEIIPIRAIPILCS